GKLSAQAHVEDVEGTWRELTDEVNACGEFDYAGERAVHGARWWPSTGKGRPRTMCPRYRSRHLRGRKGGFEQADYDVEANGEILDLKNTVNGMALRLRALAVEVTRVKLERGMEGGNLEGGEGGTRRVRGWTKQRGAEFEARVFWVSARSRCHDSGVASLEVLRMALNLTSQVRSISLVTKAVAYGDLRKTIDVEASGAEAARELFERGQSGGPRGGNGGQAGRASRGRGTWKDLTDNVNKRASNLTSQVRSMSFVTKAVAYGDLSKEIDVDVRGEMLDLKVTINEMVARLGDFSREVTRVALEVGTEGNFGGQAEVEGVQGTWKDLTDNVNKMALNLTNQVRSISLVTKALAYGDLNKKIAVNVSGEMLDLKVTINEIVERLGNFSSEVTRVALEVGTEGRLGGQAKIKGAQGTWKDLTDNVNKITT
ncbi:HAMP domain protein, partial [Mycena alexandri]